MAKEKYFWDVTVGVSYVPVADAQVQMLDVLTHQDVSIRSGIARLREIILHEVGTMFATDGEKPAVNGQTVESLLFTVTIKRGVRHDS